MQRWEQSPSDLPADLQADPSHTVLVLASPFRAPTSDERNALQTFVDRGGKVLATGRNASIYLPHAQTENEPVPSPIAKEYQPQLLTRSRAAARFRCRLAPTGKAQPPVRLLIILTVTDPLLFRTKRGWAK